MVAPCEQFKDELVSLIYPDEATSPELQSHLKSCNACQADLKSLSSVTQLYKKLPDINPPAHLTEKVYSKISPKVGVVDKLKALFLHPASVGLTVFCLTLAGSLTYQHFVSKPSSDVAQRDSLPSAGTNYNGLAQPVSYAPTHGNFRMVGWQAPIHFVEDLDKPVLRHTDVSSLEQASIEAVASFKHQLAMRHILDGELEEAHAILENITDHYMNYSHWEQAVLQHMRLVKKMGRQNEVQEDLDRLHEYAMATPEVIQQAEMEANY